MWDTKGIKSTNLIPVDKDINSIPIPRKLHVDFYNSVRTIHQVINLLQENTSMCFPLRHPAASSSLTVRILTW
jgi:hypothetical protein